MSDPRRNCAGKRDLFFDTSLESLDICQSLCARCPLFQECTRWTLAHADELEFGIFAGLSEHVRERIATGKVEYYDWRKDWRRSYYSARIANRHYRTGRSSTQGPVPPRPVCHNCGSSEFVRRHGRDRTSNRQRYQCRACNLRFLGEEL